MSSRGAVLIPILLGVVLAGCARDGPDPGPRDEGILVLAASDLLHALPAIVVAYEASTGSPVRTVFGSSGNLTAQIERGAPGDVFLAANSAFVDRLEVGGWVVGESRTPYAVGRLAVVLAYPGSGDGLASLGRSGIRRVAIANPEHAPYGAAAREALLRAHLWETVRPRLVYADNVAQALLLVRTGAVDAAIVAAGLLHAPPSVEDLLVDADLQSPLVQVGVVLRESADPVAARRFLEFLGTPAARRILREHGFEEVEP